MTRAAPPTDPSPRPPRGAVPRVLFAVVAPLQAFFRTQAAGGVVLVLAAALAFAWANSPFSASYHRVFHAPFVVQVAGHAVAWSLQRWIDDACMTVFFLLAGLEIKRELATGELRTPRRAALPLIAAGGGMVFPALIYLALNRTGPARAGWGVPMATDIAFALGVLALLRRRVPPSLFVFLTALAIFDDLGAILVIALFYGGALHLPALLAAAVLTLVLAVMGRVKVVRVAPYLVVGTALWFAFLRAGLHPTLAGVVLGLTLPAGAPRALSEVLDDLDAAVAQLRTGPAATGHDRAAVVAIGRHLAAVQPPLDRVVYAISSVVAFAIVPAFAAANAGVELHTSVGAVVRSPITRGVFLGLVLGKPIGVFGTTLLAVKLRLAPRPEGATWLQLAGIGVMAGIGFTMSLFIGALGFARSPASVDATKVGVLAASLCCAVAGLSLLALAGSARPLEAPESELAVFSRLPRFAHGFQLASWTPSGAFLGRTLAELELRQKHDVSVLGLWPRAARVDGAPGHRELAVVPATYALDAQDVLLIVGPEEAVARLLAGPAPAPDADG